MEGVLPAQAVLCLLGRETTIFKGNYSNSEWPITLRFWASNRMSSTGWMPATLILPSLFEGMPLAIIAMARGCQ